MKITQEPTLRDNILGYTIVPETNAERDQLSVMLKALEVYSERNRQYQDNWRRSGWRGVLVRIRERSDRLWDKWWERQQRPVDDEDDAIDLINFAAFMVRATSYGETTRDGSWW